MSTIRLFRPSDLLRFNAVNFDHLTETYSLHFYLQYLLNWPDQQQTVVSPDGKVMAYIIGKTEGEGTQWHGHFSAVTVAPECRRLKLATKLMDSLEALWDQTYNCYFVDLFVRKSNSVAIAMYRAAGYIVYRTIVSYYNGTEDAYDMRKSMSRDPDKRSMVPITRPVYPEELYLTM